MKLINPSFEIIEQDYSYINKFSAYSLQEVSHLKEGIYKHVEKCGRTCYKSLDKITEDSCYNFVERIIKSDHTAMLEHGTVYLVIDDRLVLSEEFDNIINSPYTKINKFDNKLYITTNFRVINGIFKNDRSWESFITPPSSYHEKRYTVKFICNRQVSHEFVRHRVFSFAQESTRYCNYNKDKFGSELTFILPVWCPDLTDESYKDITSPEYTLLKNFDQCEKTYIKLINSGWKAQQAATILPNAIKTELIMTGFESDWAHFFDLRALGTTGKPHPQAEQLAIPLLKEFNSRGYIKK